MKKWFVLAIVMSLTSIFLAEASPATEKKTTARQDQKQEKAASATQEKEELKKTPIAKFSMRMVESGQLDPAYTGIPVSEVVEAIEQMFNVEKGEFESTIEYNKRKSAARARTFLGDLTVEDTFAFVVPVAANKWQYVTGLKYNFNADTGEVKLYTLPKSSTINGIGAPDYRTNRRESRGLDQFAIEFKNLSKSTYQASNAYGATITVEKLNSITHGIAANRIPFLDFEREIIYRNPMPAVQFNMENAKAAKELPSLKALIVMKLTDPYVVYDFFHSKPTRDKPIEMSNQRKYLTGDVMGIVFYSGINGEILARIPENFGKPEAKPEPKAQVQ